MTTTANKSAVQLPDLAEGERYLIGTINDDGSITHSILLPGDNNPAPWKKQMDWAKSIGGDLLNRIELLAAFEKMPEQFQKTTYWSNQRHATAASYAWSQSFHHGYQDCNHKSVALRARAVRRLISN